MEVSTTATGQDDRQRNVTDSLSYFFHGVYPFMVSSLLDQRVSPAGVLACATRVFSEARNAALWRGQILWEI